MNKYLMIALMLLVFDVNAEYKAQLIDLSQFDEPDPASLKTQMPWETNYWECILDEMPGANNKIIASSVRKKCNQYSKSYKITKKSSLFGITNARDCVIKYAKNTVNNRAARLIRAACNKLYSD